MKIYHLIQMMFGYKTFNICYATTKDMALSFARRRLWAEPIITKYEKEKFYDDGTRIFKGKLIVFSKNDKDRKSYFEALEYKLRELATTGQTDLNGGSYLFLKEVETDKPWDNPKEIIFGQPLPVHKEDLEGDFYSVETDSEGKRWVHINGYFYDNGDHWSHLECVGVRIPLEEFISEYAARGNDYTEELFQDASQYQKDFDSFNEVADTYRHYFNGCAPDLRLPYRELTTDTPDGNFVS